MKSLKWQDGKEEAWGMDDGSDEVWGMDDGKDEVWGLDDGKDEAWRLGKVWELDDGKDEALGLDGNEFTQDGHTNFWEQEQWSMRTHIVWYHRLQWEQQIHYRIIYNDNYHLFFLILFYFS